MYKNFIIIFTCFFLFGFKSEKQVKIEQLEKEFFSAIHSVPAWKNTVKASTELLKYKPEHAEAHFRKGIALSQLSRHKESIESLDKAIKFYKNAEKTKQKMIISYSYYVRGLQLKYLGKLEEALESFDMGIKHGLNDRHIQFDREVVIGKLGRHHMYQ